MPLISVLTSMGMSSVSWTAVVAMSHSVVRLLMVFPGIPIGATTDWVVVLSGTAVVAALAITVTWQGYRRGRKEANPTSVASKQAVHLP
jgi:hypothetical protein